MEGRSFRSITGYSRPPLSSARSFRSLGPFCSSSECLGAVVRIEDAHRVDLQVRFEHGVLDFPFRMAAAIISSVGNDDQSFSSVPRMLHLAHGHMDGIQQRGASERLGVSDAIVNLVRVRRKRYGQFWPVAELDQEELVLRIGRLEKRRCRFGGLLDLVSHASAVVEQQARSTRAHLPARNS